MNIVISQPMYFPWVGMFEQVRLCDVFLYYDDVQFSKGSFTNRVQMKTSSGEGFKWLTVPLKGHKLGAKINEVEIDNNKNWKEQHIKILSEFYRSAPFFEEMMGIVESVFSADYTHIADLSRKSMDSIIGYFGFGVGKDFRISSELNIPGTSSQRVYEIVKYFKADRYLTGHGASKYLDHDLFESNGIAVEYMDYKRLPYPQLFGPFNPHVSILDLIANTGKEGKNNIISTTKNWKEFIYGS